MTMTLNRALHWSMGEVLSNYTLKFARIKIIDVILRVSKLFLPYPFILWSWPITAMVGP